MRKILLCLFLCLPGAAYAQDAPTVTVMGRGEVAVVPDMAVVSLGVTREGMAATDALRALSDGTDAVLRRLEAQGIAPRDVQTGQLSLQPRWDRPEGREAPRIVGYVARTTLDVRMRDLNALGALLDAAVFDGANELASLRFSQAEPQATEDAARRAAVADAMAKAALYAEAAGLALGPVLSIREGGGQVPGPGPMMAMEAARSMPVAPGEVTQAATVTIVFELAPAG